MSIYFTKFSPTCEKYTTIPRKIYELVKKHFCAGCKLPALSVSLVEYIICGVHCGHDFDGFICDRFAFEDLIQRLPVAVAVGGYAAAKGHKNGGCIAESHNPTPLEQTHLARVISVVYSIAKKLKIEVFGLESLKDHVNYILNTGIICGRYARSSVNMELVVYKPEDNDLFEPVLYGKKTDHELLKETLGVWLKCSNFTPVVVYHSQAARTIAVFQHPSVFNCVFYDTVAPEITGLPERAKVVTYPKTNVIRELFEVEQQQYVDLLHVYFEMHMGGYPQYPLYNNQIQMLHLLVMLSAELKIPMFNLLVCKRVLLLGCDDSYMPSLFTRFLATVTVNGPNFSSSQVSDRLIYQADFLPDDIPVCGSFMSEAQWDSLISSTGVNYDLIYCHSSPLYQEVTSLPYTDTIWSQVHVALANLLTNGCLIIRTLVNFDDLFDVSYSTEQFFAGKVDTRHNIINLFKSWAVVKPACSNLCDPTCYLVLAGYHGGAQLGSMNYFDFRSRYMKLSNEVYERISSYVLDYAYLNRIDVKRSVITFLSSITPTRAEISVVERPSVKLKDGAPVFFDGKASSDKQSVTIMTPGNRVALFPVLQPDCVVSSDVIGPPYDGVFEPWLKYLSLIVVSGKKFPPKTVNGPTAICNIVFNEIDFRYFLFFCEWVAENHDDDNFSNPIDYRCFHRDWRKVYAMSDDTTLETTTDTVNGVLRHNVLVTLGNRPDSRKCRTGHYGSLNFAINQAYRLIVEEICGIGINSSYPGLRPGTDLPYDSLVDHVRSVISSGDSSLQGIVYQMKQFCSTLTHYAISNVLSSDFFEQTADGGWVYVKQT